MSSFSLEGKTVCVVDAYGLIYQVFHAPGMEMTNSYGEPTGAVFGFARDILSIMTKLRPDYLFCAYDMHEKTFRSDLYPEYKANRSATPDDLLLQFDFTREFLAAIGTPALGVVGFEADDVMATVAEEVKKLGGKTILATADKDARQLLDDATSIYLVRKEKYYGPDDLMQDWGVTPSQVVDFQALVGDSSDNVPGVPLIGPKVASELLQKHGTLEGVFQGAVGQKGKRFENIRNGRDLALLSRRLVTLRKDAPVEIDWNAGALGGVDPDRLKALFQYWNFRSLVGKIDALVAEFGRGTAPKSEWFDSIANSSRPHLKSPAPANSTSLFDVGAEKENARDAKDDETIDPDAPLLARFQAPIYGAAPQKRDVPIAEDPSEFDVFALVGTKNFPNLSDVPLPETEGGEDETSPAIVVDDDVKLADARDAIQRAKSLAVAAITNEECEYGRVRARSANVVGLAIATDPNVAYYFPFRAPLGAKTLERDALLDALRERLEAPDVAKIGFELKYDALVLLGVGVKLRGLAFDVALADYLARAGETRRELADLAATYLDAEIFDLKTATGTGQKRVPLDAIDPEIVARRAADATLVPMRVAPILRAKLLEIPAMSKLATDLELPLVETLAEMERNGIAINPEVFRRASAEFLQRQEELEREIRALVAEADPDPEFAATINLNSPKQLQRLLFDDLKLRVVKKTKTGPSVDAEVLEELATDHPIPEKIVELRKLVKLRGTYLEPLPHQTAPRSNRICATFNQSATATGRLSSSDPNLQNIPARSENGKLIRAGFVPDRSLGFDAFLSCDYSQIELRVLAHFSGDERLRRAFEENDDVHARVASEIFGVKREDVTSDMRRKAKAVNFGLVYGQTSFGLSKSLGITPSAAAEYIDAFFANYPGVLTFFDRVLADCARRGYVQTPLGRRRALAGVRGPRGRQTLNFPERAAINAVVQGAAADIMKLAMIAVWRRLVKEGWLASRWSDAEAPVAVEEYAEAPAPEVAKSLFDFEEPAPAPRSVEPIARAIPTNASKERARLLLQIHDELLFETKREDADELAKIVVQEMTLGSPLSVPLKIDVGIGSNWGEL